MKKLIIFMVGLVFLFASCSIGIPKDVTLKMDAQYNYAIGDVSQSFNDSFDKAALFEKIEESSNGATKVYDYFPGEKNDKLQQFILAVPIGEIKLQDIILSNLPAGASLVASAAFSSLYEWLDGKTISTEDSSADVPIPSSALTGSTEVDMDISTIFSALDVLGDEFKTKTKFSSFPIYFYADLDSGFDTFTLTGQLTIKNKKSDGTYASKTSELKPKSGNEIPQVSAPDLYTSSGEVVSGSSDIVVTDVSKEAYSLYTDLADFANANKSTPGKLEISYDLGFAGQFDGQPIGDIILYAYMVIPLSFEVYTNELSGDDKNTPLNIDVIALAKDKKDKSNTDIFNRSEATDLKDTKKYLDIIDWVKVEYTAKKTPVASTGKIKLVLKSDKPPINKTLKFDGDELKIENEEFMDMLEAYPYSPSVYMTIPNGSKITLPRDISIDMNMNISLAVNGELKL